MIHQPKHLITSGNLKDFRNLKVPPFQLMLLLFDPLVYYPLPVGHLSVTPVHTLEFDPFVILTLGDQEPVIVERRSALCRPIAPSPGRKRDQG